jgi:tellurite resistance protein TehA-like permease
MISLPLFRIDLTNPVSLVDDSPKGYLNFLSSKKSSFNAFDESDVSYSKRSTYQSPSPSSTTDCEKASNEEPEQRKGWRPLVRHFTPAWGSVVMGTGIVAILLHNLPYPSQPWLYWSSVGLACLNCIFFIVILFLTIMRYLLWPSIWKPTVSDPFTSLFLGTLPIGAATLINMFVYICVDKWGGITVNIAWAFWTINTLISIGITLYVLWLMMTIHETSLSAVTATWLLPISPVIVMAASGGIVAQVLPSSQHKLWTMLASLVIWGGGVGTSMIILTLYFQRLMRHKIPPRELVVSCFLPLSPTGLGAYGIMTLGKVARDVFPLTHTLDPIGGEIFYVTGVMVGLALWGLGFVWLFLAIASIARSKIPFNMGWWGFVYPLGVFSNATLTFGTELNSPFFTILGATFTGIVVLLWIMVLVETIIHTVKGDIFVTPRLTDKHHKEASN